MKINIVSSVSRASPLLLLTPVLAACSISNPLSACSQRLSPQKLYKNKISSVAFVTAGKSLGSAFVVKHDNGKTYLLTNSHVTGGQTYVIVNWSDKTNEKGRVVGDLFGDQENDIALIEVNGIRGKVLSLDSSVPDIGEDVIAIGAPRGLDFTMTRGIVSQLRKDNQIIQLDASVNPGNSGGPLFDSSGCITGMVTFRHQESEGLNFAIAAPRLKKFLQNPVHSRFDNSYEFRTAPPFFYDAEALWKILPKINPDDHKWGVYYQGARYNYNAKTDQWESKYIAKYHADMSKVVEKAGWKFLSTKEEYLNKDQSRPTDSDAPWYATKVHSKNYGVNCDEGLILSWNQNYITEPDGRILGDNFHLRRKMGDSWWGAGKMELDRDYQMAKYGNVTLPVQYNDLTNGNPTWRTEALLKEAKEALKTSQPSASSKLKWISYLENSIKRKVRSLKEDGKPLEALYEKICQV